MQLRSAFKTNSRRRVTRLLHDVAFGRRQPCGGFRTALYCTNGGGAIWSDRRTIGFAPRWYVPRDDIDESALTPVEGQTFCPYKGLASYYDIGQNKRAAWSYVEAWPDVARVSGFVSFEPDIVDVYLDGRKLALEPGQAVFPHGIDRGLDPDEVRQRSLAADQSGHLPELTPVSPSSR